MNRLACLALASAVIALSACDQSSSPSESQVAVRVNDGEISIHQVQATLRNQLRSAAPLPDNGAAVVLEILIDQELAAQAATAENLNEQPDVIQALQSSRREALARAYHDRIADQVVGPSSEEIDRYFDLHPALFSKRRLYFLQEFAVEGAEHQIAQLADTVTKAQGTAAVASAIDRLSLAYTTRQFAQAAEDIPLLLLDSISAADVGQSVIRAEPGGARVFTIIQAHPAPVDRRTAAQPISAFLTAQRKQQRTVESMASLRQQATLRYNGAFASPQGASASSPQGAASSNERN